jgi:hypothetical protein
LRERTIPRLWSISRAPNQSVLNAYTVAGLRLTDDASSK